MPTYLRYLLLLLLSLTNAVAQPKYQPSPKNLEARERFRDYGLGIFLHWGLYSMFAQGEWYLNNANINHQEYAKSAAGFYPSRFNAREWIRQIKLSGAKYITITARHHDSFSMWDTQYSPYNIVRATPYSKDVLAELRDECKQQGIGFHIYYSLLDWHREDYYPIGKTGRGTGRSHKGVWRDYIRFMQNQLIELVRDYKADAIWLDGWWDQKENPDIDWHLEELYANIHAINPACLIGNNHHHSPFDGEDFQMFERDVPGENKAGYSGQEVSTLPLETCQTMNGMWGYKITDQNYKSTHELVRLLVQTSGRNANLLLNIGPEPSGALPQQALEGLHNLGKWLATNGSTVQGVRAGLVPPQKWGVSTQRGKTLYLHILDCTEKKLSIPLQSKVKSVTNYTSKQGITFKQDGQKLHLSFEQAPSLVDSTDFIVELRLD